ncbi:MAG: DUF262 domain-containing protein [Synergistaceae bacterium]|nr:DUF262 domain-containing protein [Synergistaceae bacterium]
MATAIKQSSHDEVLTELLHDIHEGKIQLPEFQRGWVWDDLRIRKLIASISQGYPMGVITLMRHDSSALKFGHRPLNGAERKGQSLDYLILDGQQRLTSVYCAAYSGNPTVLQEDDGKDTGRYYYININKWLAADDDRVEAIFSVPKDRKLKTNFNRDVQLDLSTSELEYEHEMFPLSLAFNSKGQVKWGDGYKKYHHYSEEFIEKYNRFIEEVIDPMTSYKLPVIRIEEATPEAVCKVFEYINTGGIILTVFELLTASFAAKEFNLRADWERCKKLIRGKNTDILDGVDEVSFMTAVTLYSTYTSSEATACKRKDILLLELEDYKRSRDALLKGYEMARKFLFNHGVFRLRDLPYPAQVIPLSVICAVIDTHTFNTPEAAKIMENWFWCGIFGEDYSDTNYVNDVEDVLDLIRGRPSQNRTVNAAFFQPERLLTLRTRQSAAYKGVMALLYCAGCKDIVSGTGMNVVKSMEDEPDIHHIFPRAYCEDRGIPREEYNSVINKTPLLAASNRMIGGAAPSVYAAKIMKKASIDRAELRERLGTNLIDYDAFMADDFEAFFAARMRSLLKLIEKAMGKPTAE